MAGFEHLHLDDVPARPGAGTGHEWLAMRDALGVGAFGLNAYRAPRAGVEIIEPHDEADDDGGGQQELYLVLTGRATFTVGDSTFEARAGSFVFIEDPALRRVAVADEPGTAVVAVGARQGVAFEPSEWEARWLAEQSSGPTGSGEAEG